MRFFPPGGRVVGVLLRGIGPLGTVTCQGMLNGLRFLSADFADFPEIHLRKSAKPADDPLLGDWLVWWVMARELWVRMNQEWQSSTARPLHNH